MQQLVTDISAAIRVVDSSLVPFKSFRPGVGPYGEPQLSKLIVEHLRTQCAERYAGVRTAREPDILVPSQWALELKIARPFGDNGVVAEHWSQNLLHPYAGNVSAIGDALKLIRREGAERRGIVVIAYEHQPPRIEVSTLISAYELLCRELLRLPLGTRHSAVIPDCVHPVHQLATVYGWELEP